MNLERDRTLGEKLIPEGQIPGTSAREMTLVNRTRHSR